MYHLRTDNARSIGRCGAGILAIIRAAAIIIRDALPTKSLARLADVGDTAASVAWGLAAVSAKTEETATLSAMDGGD